MGLGLIVSMTSNVVDLHAVKKFGHDVSKYAWSTKLEQAFAHYIAQSPPLWESVGMHADPQGFKLETTRVVHMVVQHHAACFGRGPGTLPAFSTHLDTLHEDARKVSKEDRDAVQEFLIEDPDMSLDDVWDQAGAHVKRRRSKAAIGVLRDLNAKGQDVSSILEELQEIQRIGLKETAASEVFKVDDDLFSMIIANRTADRMSLGIPDIDERLEGGPVRRTLTTMGGGSGAGKSWTCTQIAAVNLVKHLRVAYIDAEMGGLPAITRLMGWCTGLPESDIIHVTPEAKRRWEIAKRNIGPLYLRQVPSGTPITALRKYITEAKESPGFDGGVDLILTDYGDKFRGSSKYDNKSLMYEEVWTELRNMAVENDAWAVTFSQLKDLDGRTVPGWDDLAWSRFKGEISDYVVTFWKDAEDSEERIFNVAKARRAPESEITDPLVNQLDKCRIVKPDLVLDHLY